jgi:hypothetical protein
VNRLFSWSRVICVGKLSLEIDVGDGHFRHSYASVPVSLNAFRFPNIDAFLIEQMGVDIVHSNEGVIRGTKNVVPYADIPLLLCYSCSVFCQNIAWKSRSS